MNSDPSGALKAMITEAAGAIQRLRRVVVLSGAGISKESGIPTFRDAMDGLWAKFDPQQLATPTAFRRNPKLVWDWYHYRRGLLADAQPNPGHYAIAELDHLFQQVVVITQNIDGLHQKAGSRDVIPVHGDIQLDKCFANCQGDPTYIDISQLEWDREAGPPRCPHCGAYVRPAVVWFEEMLPRDAIDRAYSVSASAHVMIVVGTSGTVQPVASLPFVAYQSGVKVIEVNPEPTPISMVARWTLHGPSGEILPQLVAAIKALRSEDEAGN